jgi:hypothetical protein
MTYAIDTILRLCEENTRLKCGLPPSLNTEEVVLVVKEKEKEKEGEKKEWKFKGDDDWELLQEIGASTICQFLAEEHSYHIYKTEPPTIAEVEKLKESADLIAESQQKQIDLLLEDKRERMEDRERLVKENDFLKEQLKVLTDTMLEWNTKSKAVGRPPKKQELSPCISDPAPPYEHPHP